MNEKLLNDLSLIGHRLRAIRKARGRPLEVIAGLAGMSVGQLSGIERGLRTPSLKHLLALTDALQISPSDLVSLPIPAPGNGHTDAAVQAVRLAVLGATQRQPGGRVVSIEELRCRVGIILDMSWRCEKPGLVGELLPELIRDLHTTILVGQNVPELLDLAMMMHYHTTLWWLRVAGASLDLRSQVVIAMTYIAQERDTPAAFGLAAGGGIHVSVYSGAIDLARATLESVPDLTGSRESLQVAGSLALARSWVESVAGQRGTAHEALAAAAELAQQTGHGNAYGLAFSPLEVDLWQILALIEIGDYERAIYLGKDLNREAHPHRSRQANAWATYARALAGVRGRQRDAVVALKWAESILPLEIQRNQRTRDLLAEMVTKARHDAIGAELRGMAYRAGVL